jgi:hypothetical protein
LGFLDDKYLQPNHNSKRNSLILSFLATNKIVRGNRWSPRSLPAGFYDYFFFADCFDVKVTTMMLLNVSMSNDVVMLIVLFHDLSDVKVDLLGFSLVP